MLSLKSFAIGLVLDLYVSAISSNVSPAIILFLIFCRSPFGILVLASYFAFFAAVCASNASFSEAKYSMLGFALLPGFEDPDLLYLQGFFGSGGFATFLTAGSRAPCFFILS